MNTKHTPAPWTANRWDAETVVINGNEPKYATPHHPGRITIAHVYESAEDEGNAALIAAAPALLDALNQLRAAFIHLDTDTDAQKRAKTKIIELCPDIRDALNNARQTMWTYKLEG